MAVSYDGRYVFTAGGTDCTVNMWTTDTQSVVLYNPPSPSIIFPYVS